MSRGGRLELGTGLRWRDSIGLGLQWIGYHRARRSADSDAEETPGSGAAHRAGPARPSHGQHGTRRPHVCRIASVLRPRPLGPSHCVARARARARRQHPTGGGPRAGRRGPRRPRGARSFPDGRRAAPARPRSYGGNGGGARVDAARPRADLHRVEATVAPAKHVVLPADQTLHPVRVTLHKEMKWGQMSQACSIQRLER